FVDPRNDGRVAGQVGDDRKEGEVIGTLNDAEPEAIPLQGVGRRQDKPLPFGRRHLAELRGGELDVGRVADGVADDVVLVVVVVPAVVGAVPAQVIVDDVAKNTDIALTGHVAAADYQPGIVEALVLEAAIAADVGCLHAGERHRTDRRLPDFRQRGGRWLPRHNRARVRYPVVNRSYN